MNADSNGKPAIWLTGPRGKRYNLLDPQPGIFTPDEAANILGQKARWLGQLPRFHSVAQHCIDVGCETGLAGHVHDLGEVVTGDIPTPLKRVLETLAQMANRACGQVWYPVLPAAFKEALAVLACFINLENRWRDAILQGWGLPAWRDQLEYISHEAEILSDDKSFARMELGWLVEGNSPQSLYLSPEEAAKIWLEELWVWQETFKQNEPNRKATAMLIEAPMVWPAAKWVKSPEEAQALFNDTFHEEPWHQTIDWGWVFGGIDEKAQNER